MTAAAIFDLERVVVPEHFTRLAIDELAKADVSLGGLRTPLLWVRRLTDRWGETLPSLFFGARAIKGLAGVSRSGLAAVGAELAGVAEVTVYPWAQEMVVRGSAEGHRTVLATPFPLDLIAPLAERLGFDQVIATQLRVDHAGEYDGTIDGEWIWGIQKARAVKYWARANAVDLGASTAYSGAVSDVPLLRQVGSPVVVNPDARLAPIAYVAQWPVLWPDSPPHTGKPRRTP